MKLAFNERLQPVFRQLKRVQHFVNDSAADPFSEQLCCNAAKAEALVLRKLSGEAFGKAAVVEIAEFFHSFGSKLCGVGAEPFLPQFPDQLRLAVIPARKQVRSPVESATGVDLLRKSGQLRVVKFHIVCDSGKSNEFPVRRHAVFSVNEQMDLVRPAFLQRQFHSSSSTAMSSLTRAALLLVGFAAGVAAAEGTADAAGASSFGA